VLNIFYFLYIYLHFIFGGIYKHDIKVVQITKMRLIYGMTYIFEHNVFQKCWYDWCFVKIRFSAVLLICLPTKSQQNVLTVATVCDFYNLVISCFIILCAFLFGHGTACTRIPHHCFVWLLSSRDV